MQAVNQLGDANEVLNERAVVVMARMSNKLTGRDFSTCSSVSTSSIQHAVDHSTLLSGDTREVDPGLSVKLQVQKLIIQATSHENLCQNYVGYDNHYVVHLYIISICCCLSFKNNFHKAYKYLEPLYVRYTIVIFQSCTLDPY